MAIGAHRSRECVSSDAGASAVPDWLYPSNSLHADKPDDDRRVDVHLAGSCVIYTETQSQGPIFAARLGHRRTESDNSAALLDRFTLDAWNEITYSTIAAAKSGDGGRALRWQSTWWASHR